MVLLKLLTITTSSISETMKRQRLVHTILIASPYKMDENGLVNMSELLIKQANQPCKADVLFASGATASKASPTVNFTDAEHRFKHCMSLVNLIIKPGHGFDQEYNNYTLESSRV